MRVPPPEDARLIQRPVIALSAWLFQTLTLTLDCRADEAARVTDEFKHLLLRAYQLGEKNRQDPEHQA